MKKFILLFTALVSMNAVYADGSTNIALKIKGISNDHPYYLCLPDVGCLKLSDMINGKTFPILHPVSVNHMYLMDPANGYKISRLASPSSCNKTNVADKTIHITGKLSSTSNGPQIAQLQCAIS